MAPILDIVTSVAAITLDGLRHCYANRSGFVTPLKPGSKFHTGLLR